MADAYLRTLAWLYRLEARAGIDLKLARVARAAAALGHPERAVASVHVAGTNGKGSTAAMIAAILRAAGRRVALFTSPHLVSFRERIVVDGVPIAEAEVVAGVAHVRERLGAEPGLTCFEVITLLAWWHFARQAAEVAVLEVGLGGRLDATNVVLPEVAVITNVSHDHEAYLGRTIEEIAGEKAGIIKPGVPVVSGARGAAAAVIAARAGASGSPLQVLGEHFDLAPGSDGAFVYRSSAGVVAPLTLALAGAHQRRNAALAVRALELVPALRPDAVAVQAGLAGVDWPGRLQIVRRAPLVILDGAHNSAGIEALVAELRGLAAGRRLRILFGVMRDKAWQSMVGALGEVATEIVLTRPRQPRSADPAVLAETMPVPVRVERDPAVALRGLLATSAPDDVIVATGSLFLVGDLLPELDASLAAAAAREREAARLAGRG